MCIQNSEITHTYIYITEVQNWMTLNFLQLNQSKTEVLNIQSPHQLRTFGTQALSVGDIEPSTAVRNLGVLFQQHFSMHDQVTAIVTSCNFHLRNIGRARKYLSTAACQTAIQAMVISRLDYCCSLLANIPEAEVHRLQVVQNRAARMITRISPREHITPILASLHWLPVHLRIKFRIMVHTYKCMHRLSPSYLADKISRHTPGRALRSSSDVTSLSHVAASKNVGKGNFSHVAPATWNTLPPHIRELPTVTTFKRQLKAHYYREHFN